jgi:hypothetical protein
MEEIAALAIGIAASPFAMIPAVLLLFTDRPRVTALAFLGTWFVSIALVSTIFAMLSGAIAVSDAPPTWLSWVRIVAGLALVALAVHKWMTRSATKQMPGWMRTLQEATPRTACGLAIVLSTANPKVLLLAAAAGIDIGGTDVTLQQRAVAIGVFAAIASISVASPVLAYTLAGPRVLGPLTRVKDWLLRNNTGLLVVVFLLLGALLISNGIAGL